jgi:hypothetical protein
MTPLGSYQGYPTRFRRQYGNGEEAHSVRTELGTFDWKSSPAFVRVQELFGPNIRLKEFKAILQLARLYLRKEEGVDLPKPSRNTMRSFPLMIKYVEENTDQLIPFLRKAVLCDSDKHPIPILDLEDPHALDATSP